MKKDELLAAIVAESGLTKGDATKALAALTTVLKAQFQAGNDVRITGLGTFKVEDKPERQGRNPQTGAAITIPAKRVVKFTAEKGLVGELVGAG